MTPGEAMRAIRRRTGLNQTDFGAALGVTLVHVSRVETGHHLPGLKVLERVRSKYGLCPITLSVLSGGPEVVERHVAFLDAAKPLEAVS